MCTAYQDVLHLEWEKLTPTSVLTHEIPVLTDHPPINQKQYRLPYAHRDEVNKQVGKLLDEGVIQSSKSPWNSPLLLVPKKSGKDGEKKWRLVVEFRKLNDHKTGVFDTQN